jgi:hypothetical protein
MEAFNGKGRFSRVRRLKTPWPINTKFWTNHYRPNIMLYTNFHNNRPKGFGCPIWWSCVFCVTPVFFSLLVTSLLRNAPVDLTSLCLKRRRLPQEGAFWGSHRWKTFFTGVYPFPRIFKGHFTCKSKKSNNFWMVTDRRKISKPTYIKSGSRHRTVTSLSV